LIFSKNKQVIENKELNSPAQTKQDNSTDRASQGDSCSTQNKPGHNSPVEIAMPGTQHHSEGQPEAPDSKQRSKAKARRRRKRRQQKAVSYSEVT
jgi:hypothetical protein